MARFDAATGRYTYLELDGTEEAPTANFTPPAGTTEMTAYAYCNLHGLWKS